MRTLAVAALLAAFSGFSPAFAEDPIPVRVSLEPGGGTTRLILTASRAVSSTVVWSKGRLDVVYSEPVAITPEKRKVEDPVIRGWNASGDNKLTIDLGPGYREHETFTLRNPARLVVDLHGDANSAVASGGNSYDEAPKPDFVVVIDPGHGGVETGAVGPTGLQEKDVALDLARRLKAVLQQDSSVGVVLTRDDDRIVPLFERTAIANNNRADLFLSLHLNSAKGRKIFGAETFYLSSGATDDAARTTAALENRAYDMPGAMVKDRALDPDLELVLWDLAQNQYLAQSSRLAESVQTELNELAGTKSRGVRQALFSVLQGATMPAILVEVGFISNPEEESRFKSDEHKDKVVQAVVRAIAQFRSGFGSASLPEGVKVGGGGQ